MNNSHSFQADYFNVFVNTYDSIDGLKYEHSIMLAPTKNHIVAPPVSKEELKALADFIYKVIDET
jgi:hypothetical protein